MYPSNPVTNSNIAAEAIKVVTRPVITYPCPTCKKPFGAKKSRDLHHSTRLECLFPEDPGNTMGLPERRYQCRICQRGETRRTVSKAHRARFGCIAANVEDFRDMWAEFIPNAIDGWDDSESRMIFLCPHLLCCWRLIVLGCGLRSTLALDSASEDIIANVLAEQVKTADRGPLNEFHEPVRHE